MASITPRKPSTPSRDPTAKPAATTPAAPATTTTTTTPRRTSTSTAAATAAGGMQRARSVRSGANGTPVSARAAVRKPGSSLSISASPADGADDEARDDAALYLQDLQGQLQRAQRDADETAKQNAVLKSRLDESVLEASRLEERAHEGEEKVGELEHAKREATRQHRELEAIYEAERAQALKDKDAVQAREDELQATIQRLKETMALRSQQAATSDGEDGGGPGGHLSRTPSFRNNPSRNGSSATLDSSSQAAGFAPPSSIQRSNSRSNSKLIHQKDKIIEGLRLELAEVQIKCVEMENQGGGRMHELERQLLETRMTNARLMEDNESFQLLLSEKTLNGDLSRGDFLRGAGPGGSGASVHHGSEERAPSRNGPSTTLADELHSFASADDADAEHHDDHAEALRRVEAEVASLKDEKKALTLYINKIIGRLITHQGFESVLSNDLDDTTSLHTATPNTNKELPPMPPPAVPAARTAENEQPQGFLQRAKSAALGGVASGIGGGARKPRPLSIIAAPAVPSMNEDPATAPSIPLTRSNSSRIPSGNYSHRRSTSDAPHSSIMTNMVRTSGGPSGPTSPSLVSPRNSFFNMANINQRGDSTSAPGSRAASIAGAPPNAAKNGDNNVIPEESATGPGHERVYAESTKSEGHSHVDTPSPPRRSERDSYRSDRDSLRSDTGPGGSGGGGIMTGKQMRPLRLVQNEEEAMRARKAANRGSWIAGWFGVEGGKEGDKPAVGQQQVIRE